MTFASAGCRLPIAQSPHAVAACRLCRTCPENLPDPIIVLTTASSAGIEK
jgi:hypothetical protein